jgi:hypothetical protein
MTLNYSYSGIDKIKKKTKKKKGLDKKKKGKITDS